MQLLGQESGQSSVSVKRALKWLVMKGLVVQAGKLRSPSWGLTEEGRKLYNSGITSCD
jgi:predicted transcriptional regulator